MIVKKLIYSYQDQYQFNDQKQTPIFTFEEGLPEAFNVTGKVDLQANGQSFSFYYDNKYTRLDNLPGGGLAAWLIVLIVFVVAGILLLAGFVVFKYIKARKAKREVPFDLADFHNETPAPAPV
jgi:hypothetical protein